MARRITKEDRKLWEGYISKYTTLTTKMRGANRTLIEESSVTVPKAYEVRDFCEWLTENGYLKHGVLYCPQPQASGYETAEDTEYTFGWACTVPRQHWKAFVGYRHRMTISFKRWSIICHELAHCYCREFKVSTKENAGQGPQFMVANKQMILAFREYLREQ